MSKWDKLQKMFLRCLGFTLTIEIRHERGWQTISEIVCPGDTVELIEPDGSVVVRVSLGY